MAAAQRPAGAGGRLPRRLHRRPGRRDRDRASPTSSSLPDDEQLVAFREAAYALQLKQQQQVLELFRTHFDVWYSERSLYESGAVERGLKKLIEQGHVYELDGAMWLRTTDFDDDKDRVLIKADGELHLLRRRHRLLRRQAVARLRPEHLPARRRPPRLRQPAACRGGLRGRRHGRQHRGAHRAARQDHPGRRGGAAVQARRQHRHARGPRRGGRRRRRPLHARPLPGRHADDPGPRRGHAGHERQPRLLRPVRPRPHRLRAAQRRGAGHRLAQRSSSTRRCSTTSARTTCSG